MTDFEVTDSYLMGEIEEKEIPALEQAGLMTPRTQKVILNLSIGFGINGDGIKRPGIE